MTTPLNEEQKKYPIGGYSSGDYLRTCSNCDQQFHGHKEAFQCEPCAIKDKEFYDALTPEQRDRFDKRFANIVKLFFDGIKKDEEIARLRSALTEIDLELIKYINHNYSAKKIRSIITEALKPIIP